MASALDNLTASSVTKSTTLPAWYNDAQQKAVTSALNSVNNIPTLANTALGTTINKLGNANTNPFTSAENSLSTIAKGAANPWLTDASGNVAPDVNTALGGLFAAQNNQLHTLLPQYEAPATAGAIGGGNFGSLRGQTAADTAVTGAQAALTTQQMQAALQNQQTGVNAATGLSNVGTQEATTEGDIAKFQQADPMLQSSALATFLKGLNVPTTSTETTHQSPLAILGSLGTAYNNLPSSITGPLNTKLGGILGSIFGSGSGNDFANAIDKSTAADQLGNDFANAIDQSTAADQLSHDIP